MKKSKKHRAGAHQSPFRETVLYFLVFWNSSADPADPTDPPDPADQVSRNPLRDLPSTRAGGQDDVSSKQTPSN